MSPTVFAVVCAFIFGINIGSFLNVVIWRLPRGGSLTEPTWSYCPKCEHRLGTLDLVPVFSFLFLGRKCRYCKAPISWRYPAIETLTAALFMAVAWRFGWSADTVFNCLFVATLVCVFFIDLEHFVIPDGLNLTAAVIGIAHNVYGIITHQPGQYVMLGKYHVLASIVGLAVYAAVVYAIGLLSYVVIVSFIDKRKNPFKATGEYVADNVLDWCNIGLYYAGAIIPPLRRFVEAPEPLEGFTAEEIEADEEAGGMGSGDGKLAAGIGANLLVGMALQSFLIAIFVGAFVGCIIMIRDRKRLGGRTAIPFGPHMAIGALISLLFGQEIVHLWQLYLASVTPGTTGPALPGGEGTMPSTGMEPTSSGR